MALSYIEIITTETFYDNKGAATGTKETKCFKRITKYLSWEEGWYGNYIFAFTELDNYCLTFIDVVANNKSFTSFSHLTPLTKFFTK